MGKEQLASLLPLLGQSSFADTCSYRIHEYGRLFSCNFCKDDLIVAVRNLPVGFLKDLHAECKVMEDLSMTIDEIAYE
jgi:hypothetical protein